MTFWIPPVRLVSAAQGNKNYFHWLTRFHQRGSACIWTMACTKLILKAIFVVTLCLPQNNKLDIMGYISPKPAKVVPTSGRHQMVSASVNLRPFLCLPKNRWSYAPWQTVCVYGCRGVAKSGAVVVSLLVSVPSRVEPLKSGPNSPLKNRDQRLSLKRSKSAKQHQHGMSSDASDKKRKKNQFILFEQNNMFIWYGIEFFSASCAFILCASLHKQKNNALRVVFLPQTATIKY